MAERSVINGSYRFGFNGQEKINEMSGIGNSLDFGARIYDSRIARWLSVDAFKKPHISGYQFGGLNPIAFIDPDGNTEYYFNGNWVGSDNVDNGMIAVVKSKKVKNSIEKGKYTFPESSTIVNGMDNNDMFVIESNVLNSAYEVLQLQLGENGADREFGITMKHDENNPGRYRNAYDGIQEGPIGGGEVSLLEGPITIHGHPTEMTIDENENKAYYSDADEPSPTDQNGMLKEEMTIIVGKSGAKRRGLVRQITKKDLYENETREWNDLRDKKGTIEFYDRNNRDKPKNTLLGEHAEKILQNFNSKQKPKENKNDDNSD